MVSVVRGRLVELTIDWLVAHLELPRPQAVTPEITKATIFEDVLRPGTLRRLTQIHVGGVQPSYSPFIGSIAANFLPLTHDTELDYGDILVMYCIHHQVPIDIPRLLMDYIVTACHSTRAFPFPGIITDAIRHAGIDTARFQVGPLRIRGLITVTYFRRAFRHVSALTIS